jgi:hypothetical protein
VRFFNETTLADVTDANIDVFLLDGDEIRRFCKESRYRGSQDVITVLRKAWIAP